MEVVRSFAIPQTKTMFVHFLVSLDIIGGLYLIMLLLHALPLTDLTKKTSPNQVRWDSKCSQAFEQLKQLLCSSPILRSPDVSCPFRLQTDASDRGVGAVLTQRGEEHPVSYYSRKLLPREQRYSTVKNELLAIKLAGTRLWRKSYWPLS